MEINPFDRLRIDAERSRSINPNIFRAYDVRGIYPSELNEETAYKIGQGFIQLTKAKKVAVGRDMRLSSLALFKALTEGIIAQGVDVFNLGEIPTECLYFAVAYYHYDAGFMITASHNPPNYNGFKMVRKRRRMIEVVSGNKMAEIIKQRNLPTSEEKGKIIGINIWRDFLEHIFSFVDVKKIKPFRVVIDAGNGMAGKVTPLLASKLPIEIIPLNFKLDGNFPAHSPNPLAEGATEQIRKEIIKKKADFGFIFDGDADRIFLIDELGNLIKGDITLLLLAKYFLKKETGKGVTYNVVCSKTVPEFVKKWGGKPIRTKVGFINVREGLLKNDGVVGGEVSGHFSFRDNYYLDSGFVAFLILLQIISEAEKKVSEIAKELSSYVKSSEINFEVTDKEKILNKIKNKYLDGKLDYLDGVTVEYPSWWFNVRPSNTEPLVRLTIEADTKELLEEKKKELTALIKH